jgi:hypothetical protein
MEGLFAGIVALSEKVIGVENGVAQVFVRRSVERIRSRFGCHVDHTACVHTKFGGVVVGLHLEFLDHILVGNKLDGISIGSVYRSAVHEHRALVSVSPANLIIAGCEYILPGQVS